MLSPIFVSQVLNIFLLISTIFSLALGFFVWWQNRKSARYIIFGLLAISIAWWQFGTLMMLQNCEREGRAIFWDRFLYLGVMFISLLIYHFVILLTQRIKEKKYKTLLWLGYLISFLFLPISRTDYFLKGVFHYKWGCHTIAQPLHHLFVIYFTFYILVSFYLLWNCLRTTQDPKLKIQVKYIFLSFLFLYIGAIEYLPAYKIGIFPFGYPFTLVWLIIWTYAILRYQLLNIRVIATDILVGGIIFVILVFTILSENFLQFIGRGIFLILVIIFGWLAIRGVHRGVREKEILEEEVEKRTEELEKAKNLAEARTREVEKRKADLEHFYKLTVGRELRMIELKKKIKELEEKLEKTKK